MLKEIPRTVFQKKKKKKFTENCSVTFRDFVVSTVRLKEIQSIKRGNMLK